MMRLLRAAAFLLVAFLSGLAGAGAHAFLDHADPRAGSALKIAPTQIQLWFTESLEPAFSGVRVLNEAGERVDRGDSQVDPADLTRLRISLPQLSPGTYRVIWRVLSVDTHVTEGDFTFRVTP